MVKEAIIPTILPISENVINMNTDLYCATYAPENTHAGIVRDLQKVASIRYNTHSYADDNIVANSNDIIYIYNDESQLDILNYFRGLFEYDDIDAHITFFEIDSMHGFIIS